MAKDQETDQGQAEGGSPVSEEMRQFLVVVRRALLLVVRWIEKQLDLTTR